MPRNRPLRSPLNVHGPLRRHANAIQPLRHKPGRNAKDARGRSLTTLLPDVGSEVHDRKYRIPSGTTSSIPIPRGRKKSYIRRVQNKTKGQKIERVTARQREDESRKLRELWESFKNRTGATEARFAVEHNFGTAQNINNLLKNHQAISVYHALDLARGMGCAIEQFSPRLAALAKDLAEVAVVGELKIARDTEEVTLLEAYREIGDESKSLLLGQAARLLIEHRRKNPGPKPTPPNAPVVNIDPRKRRKS